MVGIGSGLRVSIRDLIHPSLNEPLKNQQQVTFKLVKTGNFKNHFYLSTSYSLLKKFIHLFVNSCNISKEKTNKTVICI